MLPNPWVADSNAIVSAAYVPNMITAASLPVNNRVAAVTTVTSQTVEQILTGEIPHSSLLLPEQNL